MTSIPPKSTEKLLYESYEYEEIVQPSYHNWLSAMPSDFVEYRKLWSSIQESDSKLLLNYPLHIDIEATTKCNLKCTMCPRTKMIAEDSYWALQDFEFKQYTKLIDEFVLMGGKSVKYNFLGEPLFNKQLPEMIRYAAKSGVVDIAINTNLTIMTEEIAESLIDAGITRILVSFDAATKETYESIRVNASFEKSLENLYLIRSVRDRLGTTNPLIRVGCTWQKQNIAEKEEYIKLFSGVVDVIGVGTVDDYEPLTKEMIDEYNIRLRPAGYKFICHQLYQRLFFHPDGAVTMCCNDMDREIIISDHRNNDSPVKSAWNSPVLDNIRSLHQSGEFFKSLPCARCNIPRLAISEQLRLLGVVK